MTIKGQWLRVLIVSAVLSVIINSLILGSLMNGYFVDNSTKNYDEHFEQIAEFTRKALSENYTPQQLSLQLATHLIDPIIGIKLYNADGALVVNVSNTNPRMSRMMEGHMMNRMMGMPAEEIDTTEISEKGILLGRLDIVRYGSLRNSMQTRMFAGSLIGNSVLSFFIAVMIMMVIGLAASRKMSRDLINTAAMATDIDLGHDTKIERSKVYEIQIIQRSLETLQSKLKLKQMSRKRLVDELIHQTRTPLTILKTHLEGLEDGVLTMSPEEIKTCQAQVESIAAMIAGMSTIIDAEKDLDDIQIEEIEVGHLLKQIVGALNVQFDKKQIQLSLLSNKKVLIKSDKSKLSQIIYNILTNAYKYTEPNGKVSVTCESEPSGIVIKIEDTGQGIDEKDMEHLFDAYYRGANAMNVAGEGIGLYVVKEDLDRINGKIHVESEKGKGSRFIIEIPYHISDL